MVRNLIMRLGRSVARSGSDSCTRGHGRYRLRRGVASLFGDWPSDAYQREKELSGLFRHRHVPRMLEPDDVLFRRFHLVEPIGGDFRIHVPIMPALKENEWHRKLADVGEIEPE